MSEIKLDIDLISVHSADKHPRADRESALGRRYREFAKCVIGDLLDRLADEGLDQQRLGFLFGKPARAQVEQQAVVERAGGGAVSARHVVGEDFQLRLVVGLGLIRQQQRPRDKLPAPPDMTAPAEADPAKPQILTHLHQRFLTSRNFPTPVTPCS